MQNSSTTGITTAGNDDLGPTLHGAALVLEAFGDVIAPGGGAGVVISSQSGHRLRALTAEEDLAPATTPTERLLDLPLIRSTAADASLYAYQASKRGNPLRVATEAVRRGRRGARANTVSPGIVITPLAHDESSGPRGAGYRHMLEASAVGRAGWPDEVGNVGAPLMGEQGAFVTGSDIRMDGGVTASYRFGDLAPGRRSDSGCLPIDAVGSRRDGRFRTPSQATGDFSRCGTDGLRSVGIPVR